MAETGRFRLLVLLILSFLLGSSITYSQSTSIPVVSNDATSITSGSAVLNGTINPDGNIAAAWFDWGTTTSLGTRSDVQMFQNITSATKFTVTLRSLQPRTTYYFRAVGYRSVAGAGNVQGDIKTFTTTGDTTPTGDPKPNGSLSVTTGDANSITAGSVVLNASVNPGGAVSAWFEWGTTSSLGTRTEVQALTGSANVGFKQSLGSLQPHTSYYFRAVAYNVTSGNGVVGDVKTFTTSDATEVTVKTSDAGSITSNSVVFNGTINPGGSLAGGWFEWGTSTALGTRTEVQKFDGSETVKMTQALQNLQPSTSYYFRAVGYRSGGSIFGDTHSFSTTRVPSTAPQKIPEVEQGSIKSGYVIITPEASSGAPTPTLTFGLVSGGAVQSQAAIIPAPMTTDASMFVEVIPSISRNIGVAIVNPGPSVNAVTLTLRDENGFIIGTPANVSLAAHSQVAKFINELFGSETIGSGLRGSLRMQSAAPFGVVGFRFSGAVFSTLAVAMTAPVSGVPTVALTAGSTANSPQPGTAGGADALIIPQFALAGGWASQIALVNNTNATISGRIDVFDTSGIPMPVKLNGETRSTFIYSIPVGGTFILAPRDANGQAPM